MVCNASSCLTSSVRSPRVGALSSHLIPGEMRRGSPPPVTPEGAVRANAYARPWGWRRTKGLSSLAQASADDGIARGPFGSPNLMYDFEENGHLEATPFL